MAVFTKTAGNSLFQGRNGTYDQVDYQGSISEYSFIQNANGTVTVSHSIYGTDTLSNIEGFWFAGDSQWYSMDDALAMGGSFNQGPAFLTGTTGDDYLEGSNTNNEFFGDTGNDAFNGNGGDYNQVNYQGSLSDFTFSIDADGIVTASSYAEGTDTMFDIDGLWFGADNQWYSMDEVLQMNGATPPVWQPPVVEPPVVEPPVVVEPPAETIEAFQEGGDGNDYLLGGDMNNVFFGGAGDDVIDGAGGEYNQVDYEGSIYDFTMSQAQNGVVTVSSAAEGTDLLANIDGFWFGADSQWYSLEDALAITGGNSGPVTPVNPTPVDPTPIDPTPVDPTPVDPTPVDPTPVDPGVPAQPGGGTFVNGVLTGTNGVDALVGGTNATTFYAGMGIGDTIVGNSNNDTLFADGDVEEWTFTNVGDGSIIMQHATWGVNTISGIEQITFTRSGTTMTPAQAIAQTAGLPAFRVDGDGQLNGTPFDDIMIGTAGDDSFYGGVGNDFYDGGAGFDQANFDGSINDFNIFQNADGSFTIASDIWGTDTFTNIEGLFFNANNQFVRVEDLFGAA